MVFVTGGTGFLGSYIIKELVEKNYAVRAIRRSKKIPFYISPEILNKVEWIDGDVLDVVTLEEAMTGADAVIHAAAKVSFQPKERKEMYKTNIEGTANVVNTALSLNIKKMVHVSSIAALGRTMEGEKVDETKQWKDSKHNTNYAISKYHGEMETWRAIGEGLNAVIVNPSTVIGFGDWNTTSCAIFKTVYDQLPWYTNGINGFIDVEDAAKAIGRLMENDITNERFILSGETSSFREVFNLIADEFGKRHPTMEATPFLAAIAWRIEKIKSMFTGKPSILTKESAMLAMTKTYFDNSKILKALPDFSFTPLQQTIKKACVHYAANASANS
ncbi:MAG TPA: NAD-dependent epimerase/dehydratase family protein [Puia sp.]|nr:NAD-dependent epimerase/dehydratase family protein [Puia sp.]